ncbi:DUF6268 family outer membrane beta-barrel protein [Pontimicrobium sp. IMCC45349]|uniref:DUF6268 family outer membrane beta-barrel protein n=1 Tax=Pontimicrobium sp. IMCC45349 TaxID=3391574 RepID=UPI00399FAD5C
MYSKASLRFLLVVALTLNIFIVTAQEKKEYSALEDLVIANLAYTNYGESEFSEGDQDGKVGFSELRFAFALPKLLKNKKTILIHGLEFTNLKPSFSELPNSSSIDRNFYSVAYRFSFINPIGEKGWNYNIGLKPTLASDFKESISSNDFIFQTSVLFSKRSSERFKYGFGVSYNTRFGKKQVLPIVQLIYRNDKWLTVAYLPAYLGHYYLFEKSRLGISLNLNGNNYNFDNNNTLPLDLDKLSYSRINLGPEYEFKLANKLKLNLNAGVTLANKLDWLNNDGDSELDLTPKNSVFFKFGLKYVK